MKILKRIFKLIGVLLGVLVVTIITVLLVDNQRSSYLKMEKIGPAEDVSYLMVNVNIVPMTRDTILVDKMVLIENGLIENIADRIEIEGIETIDAANKYLTPGLIDMHVHIWDKYELGLYLSYGVTAVRNVWGMPMHLRLKNEINKGELLSPMLYTTGPKLTGPEFIGDDNLQLYSPEEAKQKVLAYKKKGYDFIKTYNGLTPDIFDAVKEQAKISKMDIVAHPSHKVPYSYHFDTQIKSIEHAEDIIQQPLNYKLDSLKLKEVIIGLSKSKHTSFCPTLTVYHNIYRMLTEDSILTSKPLELMNPLIIKVDSKAQFDRWYYTKLKDSSIVKSIKDQHDFHLKTVKDMNEAGVNIISGTDAGIGVTVPGMSIHKELALYKEAGLSNYEVLRTATANASRTHSVMNNMGTIEIGKIANLILVDRNPLTDLSALEKPSTVFIKGRKLNREHLDHFKEQARNRKNLIASGLRYLENLLIEK